MLIFVNIDFYIIKVILIQEVHEIFIYKYFFKKKNYKRAEL
jgi:hypothetical protein